MKLFPYSSLCQGYRAHLHLQNLHVLTPNTVEETMQTDRIANS